jgi:hypothetical protein
MMFFLCLVVAIVARPFLPWTKGRVRHNNNLRVEMDVTIWFSTLGEGDVVYYCLKGETIDKHAEVVDMEDDRRITLKNTLDGTVTKPLHRNDIKYIYPDVNVNSANVGLIGHPGRGTVLFAYADPEKYAPIVVYCVYYSRMEQTYFVVADDIEYANVGEGGVYKVDQVNIAKQFLMHLVHDERYFRIGAELQKRMDLMDPYEDTIAWLTAVHILDPDLHPREVDDYNNNKNDVTRRHAREAMRRVMKRVTGEGVFDIMSARAPDDRAGVKKREGVFDMMTARAPDDRTRGNKRDGGGSRHVGIFDSM